ncbi:MAG: ABC transporter substrate-binding protein [Oscillospiraceae bacterium]|nr:ABC transporter substrate-binding protein [Oscillospiraceae bacterium]
MKKRILALILVLALSVLPACGKTAEPVSTPETTAAPAEAATPAPTEAVLTGRAATNEINIGIAQDFDSLDPDTMTAAGTKEVMFNVFEGLVKPSSDGEIVPAVASDVVKSDDGLTYTFTLRQGVKFHNGNPVTMQDVVFSVERRWNSDDAAAILAALSVIDHLDHDDSTLTITLSEPSNEFLAAVMNAYILPADYDAQATAPVGTGPYKFVSRTVQDSLVLERFADYWGTPGKLDKVTFKILENAEGLVLGLQSGALDLVAHLSSDQTVQLNSDDFAIQEGSMNLVQALYLNNAEKPFDDVRVRQALCYAVDKQAVIDLAFDGYGIPLGTSMFPSFSKYYDDTLTDYYTLNVEKAKELLKEAGYPDGFEMTITVPSNYTPHVNTATVLVELLREIGVKATVQPVDWSTWLEEVYSNRNFQSTVTGLTSDNMTARKLLERFGSKVGNNFTNYSNKEYDEILSKALSETDDAAQTELYRSLERNLTENAANVYLQDMADLVAMRNGLEGLTFYPIYVLDVSTLSWAK